MNKAYYVNRIQGKEANAYFRLSIIDGKTRVGLFAKKSHQARRRAFSLLYLFNAENEIIRHLKQPKRLKQK